MTFPKVRPHYFAIALILFALLAFTMAGVASVGAGSVPQRLRVRLEPQRLRAGDTTKVIVEFLDRDYGQIVNDATRTIVLSQTSSGSKLSGSGRFDREKITIKPGAWSGEASFTSNGPGRLFITASSEGLEAGKTLALITPNKKASLLSRLVSFFEPVAHAQDNSGFEISPRELTATADGRHRATFQVSFLESPPAGTTIRINTDAPGGEILYKGDHIGTNVADIKLTQGEDISGEISVHSGRIGKFKIMASVRPNGPSDEVPVEFTPARPSQIIFDSDPMTIGSEASDVPLTVRLADDGGFPIEPDREREIRFSRTNESDQISFEPQSVVLAPGQAAAQVVFRLKELPLGNEIRLLASSPGIRVGQKNLVIKSAIERLKISGPTELTRGGTEAEYTIYLGDKDDKHCAADWDRQIDLHVTGGTITPVQVVIPKGARKAVVKYSSAGDAGKYVLTASSTGIEDGTQPIGVLNEAHWLACCALLGGLVGGIARQLHKDKKFGRIRPRWTGKHWDPGFAGRLAGSLVAALFFYWTFKLGLSQALGSPVLPAALDLGTRTVAFFFGGIGGFAGTVVLDKLTRWFLPEKTRQAAPAQ